MLADNSRDIGVQHLQFESDQYHSIWYCRSIEFSRTHIYWYDSPRDIGVLPPLGVYDPLGLIETRDMRRSERRAARMRGANCEWEGNRVRSSFIELFTNTEYHELAMILSWIITILHSTPQRSLLRSSPCYLNFLSSPRYERKQAFNLSISYNLNCSEERSIRIWVSEVKTLLQVRDHGDQARPRCDARVPPRHWLQIIKSTYLYLYLQLTENQHMKKSSTSCVLCFPFHPCAPANHSSYAHQDIETVAVSTFSSKPALACNFNVLKIDHQTIQNMHLL